MQPKKLPQQLTNPTLKQQFISGTVKLDTQYKDSCLTISINNNACTQNKCSLTIANECWYAAILNNQLLYCQQQLTKNVIKQEDSANTSLKFSITNTPQLSQISNNEHAITSKFLILTLSCFITNETDSSNVITADSYYTSLIVKIETNNYSLATHVISWVNIDENWKRNKEESIKWLIDMGVPQPFPYNNSMQCKIPFAIAPPPFDSYMQGNPPVFLNYNSTFQPHGTTLNPVIYSSSSDSSNFQVPTIDKTIHLFDSMGEMYTIHLTGANQILKRYFSVCVKTSSNSYLPLDFIKIDKGEVDKIKTMVENKKYVLKFKFKTVGETSYVAVFVAIPTKKLTLKIIMPVYTNCDEAFYTREEEIVIDFNPDSKFLLDQFLKLSPKEKKDFWLEVKRQMTEKNNEMKDDEEGFSDIDEL